MIAIAASLGTWLSVGSTLFAAVAAGATIVAVIYARRTVTESEEAAQAAARRHNEQLEGLDLISASAHVAHENEMRERRIAFDRDVIVRGLTQLQRVAQVLRELIDAAREERTHPSERITDIQPGREISSTPVQMLQVQLRIEVRILKAFGGPDLSDVIPGPERDDEPGGLQRLWFDGVTALEKINGYIGVYEATQPSWLLQRLYGSTDDPTESVRQTPT